MWALCQPARGRRPSGDPGEMNVNREIQRPCSQFRSVCTLIPIALANGAASRFVAERALMMWILSSSVSVHNYDVQASTNQSSLSSAMTGA